MTIKVLVFKQTFGGFYSDSKSESIVVKGKQWYPMKDRHTDIKGYTKHMFMSDFTLFINTHSFHSPHLSYVFYVLLDSSFF